MTMQICRWLLCCACWGASSWWLAATAWSQSTVAPGEALSPQAEQQKFHLPPGFEIQLFASEPAIHKPINLTFDAAGRLFVTDTVEYPYPAAEDTKPRDSVKILVDRDNDGRADDITTFVDGLNIPLGVMPIQNGVIVYSIPSVKRCLDTNGDGKADTREPLYANFEFRDTHGMVNSFTRGLDGWLYACHGFANTSTPQGSDGRAITMNSGNTFRMRIDGSHLEYFTHGQVNPFGLTLDPLGNLYSADCHTMPIYMLLRGAYYPSFGKAHDGIEFGPTMIGHNHGSSGIGGIAYYAADQFPPQYRDTIMVGNPVTGRVNHDRLRAHGSTYEAIELPDFVTCDDPWFRPVNLQVGPDGALYIADFYNRIIGHYEVPLEHPGRDRERGRIWRVVYTGKGINPPPVMAIAAKPNPSTASLDSLLDLLNHGNLTVRTLATHELVDRVGAAAVESLQSLVGSAQSSANQRIHGLWALERLGGLNASLVETLAHDADRGVRVHLVKMLAERSWSDSPWVLAALSDSDPFVRRAAADALGRHPSANNINPLLALWAATAAEDTHLIHVARMALRDQLLKPGIYAQLVQLVGASPEDRERVANVSLGVPNQESAAYLLEHLQTHPTVAARDRYLHHAARYLPEERLPQIYRWAREQSNLDADQQAGIVRALKHSLDERGGSLPAEINDRATRLATGLLLGQAETQVRAGIDLAREFRTPAFDTLAEAAGPAAKFPSLRSAAIDACVACDMARSLQILSDILAKSTEPLNLRQQSAAALGRSGDEHARDQLVAQLQIAPEQLAVEIANALADSPAGGEALLAMIAGGRASPRLVQERAVAMRLRNAKLDKINERIDKLTAGLPPRDARTRALIDARRERINATHPDLAQGVAIFEKHCAICHRIGERGAKIGPNLDGVGIRGLDRLLEDVLDPNRNVDQAFRTTQIVSTDGRIISGLALREEGRVLVLADAQGKELRVPQEEIDQRAVSPLSLMPTNVTDLVSEAEFVNLLGYLLSQKQPK